MTGTRDWSIRWRLTRAILAVVLLGWLGTILLTLWFLDHELTEGFDEEMQLVAETTLRNIDATGGPVIPHVIGVSPNQEDRIIRISRRGSPPPEAPWTRSAEDGFSESNGWRVLRATGERAIVEVAHAHSAQREELFETASALIIVVLPMVALLVWGVTRSLARTVAPVERMAAAIGARRPDDLSPVTGSDIPRELRPLTEGLNSYLARIDDLRQVERRFVANAAHELRTPVAAIRARLDLSGGDEATIRSLDDLTRRIERLLQLSRSEAGVGLGGGPADLVQILRLLVQEAARRDGVQIRFDDGDLESLALPLDPDALAILLRNLIDNAIEHGNGTVRLRLSPYARLVIENPTTQRAFIEEPFGKGPQSRGTGLGLSIVATLAKAMDVQVEKTIEQGIARVTLQFH